jgi:capsular exopolysaccharide synthesis family protein
MNAPSPLDPELGSANELRNLVISHLNLSAATVAQIFESMLPSESDFTDTALRLGFVTHEAVAEALVQARHDLDDPAGLIETAIRKMSSDHRVVVRHGESVKPGEQLILAHDPYNPRSERIRALRTELLLLNESSRGANIVPVLSPNSQEGRSQLAAELAISFAQLGRRSLLVDADMRKPQQHVLFGSANEDGLSKSLTLGVKPNFHPVIGSPQMHFLNSGPLPPNPLELLSDGRFEKLLSEWRNSYEFIVIDTPPVSLYADALAIATMAARVLLVSRSKHTSFKTTRDMLRRLEKTQSHILGAVLNYF